jgi:hypothetical protein
MCDTTLSVCLCDENPNTEVIFVIIHQEDIVILVTTQAVLRREQLSFARLAQIVELKPGTKNMLRWAEFGSQYHIVIIHECYVFAPVLRLSEAAEVAEKMIQWRPSSHIHRNLVRGELKGKTQDLGKLIMRVTAARVQNDEFA